MVFFNSKNMLYLQVDAQLHLLAGGVKQSVPIKQQTCSMDFFNNKNMQCLPLDVQLHLLVGGVKQSAPIGRGLVQSETANPSIRCTIAPIDCRKCILCVVDKQQATGVTSCGRVRSGEPGLIPRSFLNRF
jgi:hypothetical protein